MKDVIAGIISCQGKMLIAARSMQKSFGGFWEFPGGKVEPGETPEQCLVREIQEEFGITITPSDFFMESVYQNDRHAFRLLAYHAKWDGQGELVPTEHESYKWVSMNELPSYTFAPADIPFVDALMEKTFKNPLSLIYSSNRGKQNEGSS